MECTDWVVTRLIFLFPCHFQWPLQQGSQPDLKLNTRTRSRKGWQGHQAIKPSCPNDTDNKRRDRPAAHVTGMAAWGLGRQPTLITLGAQSLWLPNACLLWVQSVMFGREAFSGLPPTSDGLQLLRIKPPCPKIISIVSIIVAYTFVSTRFLKKESGTRLTQVMFRAREIISSSKPPRQRGVEWEKAALYLRDYLGACVDHTVMCI